MRQDGLVARKRRRHRSTTDAAHAHPTAPNLLERRIGTEETGGPDRVWASDITYVPTREGWLYLAAVLDLGTRRVVGWSMQDTLEAKLATGAIQTPLLRRRSEPDLIHHSDRDAQYVCQAYRDLLEGRGLLASMSRKGDCWDNAVAESFFATLEWELIEDADWHTHEEARRAIFDSIEIWYNRQRRHCTLGYLSPAEYEAQLALTQRAA